MIIRGGENLSPSEIEDSLLRHGAVQAAVVVGVPDPEWGESVVAAVVLDPATGGDPTGDVTAELVEWVRGSLGSLKAPGRIVVYDDLPTTATGKLLRRVVHDELTPPPAQ